MTNLADRQPVPAARVDAVRPLGLDGLRVWGDGTWPARSHHPWQRVESLRARYEAAGRPPEGLTVPFLAISGGATYGSYAAGLLAGWSAHGTRPPFQVVTGVSVGALIAPFAFLGPSSDEDLREALQETMAMDLARPQLLQTLFGAPSVLDPGPLEATVERLLPASRLEALAEAWEQGRQLLVGTTNLDAGRFVIWNLGRIAAEGSAEAHRLARRVVLASASVPGAYPPVTIDVVDPRHPHERLQEAHVDGGVANNVFAFPLPLGPSVREEVGFPLEQVLYVIQNDHHRPPYRPVDANLATILRATLRLQAHFRTVSDASRIGVLGRDGGCLVRFATIPDDFDGQPASEFDPSFMQDLYDLGYRQASRGYPWGGTAA